MKYLLFGVLTFGALLAAQDKQVFTGVITDNDCGNGDHSQMHMGSTDAACAIACVKAGDAAYVLYDGKATYKLSDQKTLEKFAAQKVTVMGRMDPQTKVIQVESITAAK